MFATNFYTFLFGVYIFKLSNSNVKIDNSNVKLKKLLGVVLSTNQMTIKNVILLGSGVFGLRSSSSFHVFSFHRPCF